MRSSSRTTRRSSPRAPTVDPKTEYDADRPGDHRDAVGDGALPVDRTRPAAAPGVSPAVAAWLKEKTVAGPFTLLNAENVGPQVGKDLREKGTWAVVLSWAAMLAYVGIRFRSFSFGTAAVVALIHDTWVDARTLLDPRTSRSR